VSNISAYSQTAANNNATPPNGWPEGQAPSTVNDCAREMMAGIARWYAHLDNSLDTTGSSNAYVLTTGSSHAALADIGVVTFKANHSSTGAATLAVDGLASKAIRWNGAAIIAGSIVSGNTYAVAYNATNDVFDLLVNPVDLPSLKSRGITYPTTDGTSGQSIVTNGAGVLSFAAASQNVEYSARTSNTILGAGDKAKLIEVTSGTFTQTIAAAATIGAGWWLYYKNSGTGTVTMDADGSETIDGATTKVIYAGEEFVLQCDGANFHTFCADKRTGSFLISSQTASNSAAVDFTGISSAYDEYEIHVLNAIPASDSGVLNLRTSANAGSSYDSGATDYKNNVTDAAEIALSQSLGSDTNEQGYSGVIRIIRPSEATYTVITAVGAGVNQSGVVVNTSLGGYRASAAAVDAVRLLMSAGNIESGIFKLYGVRK